MYSILPAVVSFLFLFYGLYVVRQKGITRTSTSFLVLCVTTFFWQFTWAALFQANDPNTALTLIKLGWLLILFLPTSLYHFYCEITNNRNDLKFVIASYIVCLLLAALLIVSNLVIDGYYEYFWGYYPKAGPLLFIHIIQTVAVVARGLVVTYSRYRQAKNEEKSRLSSCLGGLLVYCVAAVDYLCNYGFEFYPPGVLFISASLGIVAVAATKYDLMDTARIIAASVVHEWRTPLATVKLQAQILGSYLPILINAYEKAAAHNLIQRDLDEEILEAIARSGEDISEEINHTNQSIDLMLATFSNKNIEGEKQEVFSASDGIESSIKRYPFTGNDASLLKVNVETDFRLSGSKSHFIFVISNLIKNALYAIQQKGSGDIVITIKSPSIMIQDSGSGIHADVLPHIFNDFYTTKPHLNNAGVGLSFCKRVVESFGGKIICKSEYGRGSCFYLNFHDNKLSP